VFDSFIQSLNDCNILVLIGMAVSCNLMDFRVWVLSLFQGNKKKGFLNLMDFDLLVKS